MAPRGGTGAFAINSLDGLLYSKIHVEPFDISSVAEAQCLPLLFDLLAEMQEWLSDKSRGKAVGQSLR